MIIDPFSILRIIIIIIRNRTPDSTELNYMKPLIEYKAKNISD